MLIVQIIDLLTLFVVTLWLSKLYFKQCFDSRFFISLLLYIFYMIPLGLDWFYEMADYTYSGWWGFMIPRGDFFTNVLYDVLFLYTFYVLLIKTKSYKNQRNYSNKESQIKSIALYLLFIALIPPVAVVLIMRQPAMLMAFQWRELGIFSTSGSYATIEKITYIAVSCSVLLFFSKKNIILNLFSLLLLIMNVCIQGKRAILFYALINIVIVLYIKFRKLQISPKKMTVLSMLAILLCAALMTLMINMTIAVKLERGYDPNNTSAMYTTSRIDFFRDDRVRLSIYSCMNEEEVEILQYPAQTFVSDLFAFIPINYIASMADIHHYSYQTYFTHALERKKTDSFIDVQNRSYMTVCFISEMISNIGFLLTLLLLPKFCLWISKKADDHPYPLNALILCVFASLNMFDFTYMAYYIEAVLILCWFYHLSKHRKINYD